MQQQQQLDPTPSTESERTPTVMELYAIYEREVESASLKVDDAREAVAGLEEKQAALGTFASRFTETRKDLLDVDPDDLLPPESLPGSNGVILKGVRHLWPMERKGGKSLATLVMGVDMILAGCRVAVLDRENGWRRYALRLKDIVDARDFTDEQREAIRAGLAYYGFPQIRRGDREELAAELSGFDLVVFDSSRAFLTSLGLGEDKSDDYGRFMGDVIEPLFEAGTSTLILDNSGWSDSGRPRGSSSKEDLNEHLFISEKTRDFDRDTTGTITLEVKVSRDGVPGRWTMDLGGGVYDPWVSAPDGKPVGKGGGSGSRKSEKRTENVERARVLLSEEPGISNVQLGEALGVSDKTARTYRVELSKQPS